MTSNHDLRGMTRGARKRWRRDPSAENLERWVKLFNRLSPPKRGWHAASAKATTGAIQIIARVFELATPPKEPK